MATIKSLTKDHLIGLMLQFDTLADEKAKLQAAAARITAIDQEQSDLVSDAQEILVRYNAQHGTNHTLPQVRAALLGPFTP